MTLEGHTILNFFIEDTATEDDMNRNITLDGGGLGWPLVLQSMIGFLSDFYGYDISQEIAIRRSPSRVNGGWKGQYFGVATDSEIKMARLQEEAREGSEGGQE